VTGISRTYERKETLKLKVSNKRAKISQTEKKRPERRRKNRKLKTVS